MLTLALSTAALAVRPVARHVAPLATAAAPADAFTRLQGVRVLRVSDGENVALTEQWKQDERAALFFFRSFG